MMLDRRHAKVADMHNISKSKIKKCKKQRPYFVDHSPSALYFIVLNTFQAPLSLWPQIIFNDSGAFITAVVKEKLLKY